MPEFNPYESPVSDSPAQAEYFGHAVLLRFPKRSLYQPYKPIIAVIEPGVVYTDQIVLLNGLPTSDPKFLPWDHFSQVTIRQRLSKLSLLSGLFGLFVVCLLIISMMTTNSSLFVNVCRCVILVLVGPQYLCWVLGAKRNEAIFTSGTTNFGWMSAPLQCRKTLPFCKHLAELCREKSIACQSHIENLK